MAEGPEVTQRFVVRIVHRHSGFVAADVHEALVFYDSRSRAPHEEPARFMVSPYEPGVDE